MWNIVSEKIGEGPQSLFGFSVSLDPSGQLLAVGAPYHSSHGVTHNGRVYAFSGDTFEKSMGEPLNGEVAKELFGWSISIKRGAIKPVLAVGSPKDKRLAEDSGHASVFWYTKSFDTWNPRGGILRRSMLGDQFGISVSLSHAGDRLAIGSPGNNEIWPGGGFACVYYDGADGWTQFGSNLYGDAVGDKFGYALDLSDDGRRLAVGAPGKRTGASSAITGQVKVFQLLGQKWEPSTPVIGKDGENMGFSVSVSYNGTSVSVGAPTAGVVRSFV